LAAFSRLKLHDYGTARRAVPYEALTSRIRAISRRIEGQNACFRLVFWIFPRNSKFLQTVAARVGNMLCPVREQHAAHKRMTKALFAARELREVGFLKCLGRGHCLPLLFVGCGFIC
jgi:hypothetical protein